MESNVMRHSSSPALLLVAGVVLAVATVESAAALPGATRQDRTAPGPPHETKIVVGELPPTSFELRSIDGETFELASAGRPILLLFFRGTW